MKNFSVLVTCFFALCMSGCGYIIDSQTRKAGDQLSASMMNFEDPQTVAEAMPTLLILADSMASSKDAGPYALFSAAKMYGAYSSAFANNNKKRQKILTNKGMSYVMLGSCKYDKAWCKVRTMSSDEFAQFVQKLNKNDVEVAYAYASTLLSYIDAHNDDWAVIADLAKATQLMELVARYDEGYDNGGPLLYLGAISTTLPPAMGGKPDVGKNYFDRAIKVTQGKNLLVKVEYARRYARMTFDKDLHHQLLTEVLEADPKQEGLTLMNTWAQQEAQRLLDDESNYFD
jgi:hypothetical protein